MIINEEIDNGKAFDWGRTSEDYARFRDIYPEIFYRKIIELGMCTEGQRVLDLGTGTGVLPRNLYKYGAGFVGGDVSRDQIEQAKTLSDKAGMDIEYIVSSAEDIGFEDSTFDVVTACQCFWYFDRNKIFPKIHKILKHGGHFCILFMAWLPFESEIAKASEDLILKYNPSWTGGRMERTKPEVPEESKALFEVENSFTYDLNVTFTRESWHGRMKACRGIGASSLTEEQISQWEREHLAYLGTVPEQFDIIHFVSVLNLRRRDENNRINN